MSSSPDIPINGPGRSLSRNATSPFDASNSNNNRPFSISKRAREIQEQEGIIPNPNYWPSSSSSLNPSPKPQSPPLQSLSGNSTSNNNSNNTPPTTSHNNSTNSIINDDDIPHNTSNGGFLAPAPRSFATSILSGMAAELTRPRSADESFSLYPYSQRYLGGGGGGASSSGLSSPSASSLKNNDVGTIGSSVRRARAGTVPSRFSSAPQLPNEAIFKAFSPSQLDERDEDFFGLQQQRDRRDQRDALFMQQQQQQQQQQNTPSSRLRAGSLNTNNRQGHLFGSNVLSSSGLSNSVKFNDSSSPISPTKEDQLDSALGLLGLNENNRYELDQPRSRGTSSPLNVAERRMMLQNVADFRHEANRLRSYSVNTQENTSPYRGSSPYEFQGDLQPRYVDKHRITEHHSRPRARTTGILDTSPPLGSNARRVLFDDDRGASANFLYEEGTLPTQDTPSPILLIRNVPTTPAETFKLRSIISRIADVAEIEVFPEIGSYLLVATSLEGAIAIQQQLHQRELFPGFGAAFVSYVTFPQNSVTGDMQTAERPVNSSEMIHSPDFVQDLLEIVRDYMTSNEEIEVVSDMLNGAIKMDSFAREISSAPDGRGERNFDAPRLRELRKRMDFGSIPQDEIELIAHEMLDEVAELSSDYLGNTIVQKLFERCGEETKEFLLQRIAPYLAEIGVHKNGTWAAQKIIELANTHNQKQMIVDALYPYAPILLLDQFGNYVVQCCLKFGAPYNNFIFEAMLCRFWETAQARFGSRAMRACLESQHTSKEQQKLIAASVTMRSSELATDTNGALLLTWLLDTCNFPNRFRNLAPRLAKNLVSLCVHKLASLTVLKLINQRSEDEARNLLLQELFDGHKTDILEKVLRDQHNGATIVYKILTTPYIDESERAEYRNTVKQILVHLNIGTMNGYKRIMEEVGLSTRNTQGHSNPHRQQNAPPNVRNYPQGYGLSSQNQVISGAYSPSIDSRLAYGDLQQLPAIDRLSMGNVNPNLYMQQALLSQNRGLSQQHNGQQHNMQTNAPYAYNYQGSQFSQGADSHQLQMSGNVQGFPYGNVSGFREYKDRQGGI